MVATVIEFANLLAAALLVGAVFGVWLSFNPAGLDGPTYVALQQQAIRTLNVKLPALGGLTILLTLAAAWLAEGDRTRLLLLAVAIACFAGAGLITRFLNQPINAIVINWSAHAPPAEWALYRDAWWRWHVLRTIVAVCGLSLLIAAALIPVK
jgi:uncharacterized membrane protein